MKRLTLVRHAKSSRKHPALADIDRPLNSRGKHDAWRMAAYLEARGDVAEIILASPARRTCQTARLFAATLFGGVQRIRREPALYEASAATLLERVRALDESWQHVMLIGHNPGLSEFSSLLTAARLDNLPTCGVLVIDLVSDLWQEVDFGCGQVILAAVPKGLP